MCIQSVLWFSSYSLIVLCPIFWSHRTHPAASVTAPVGHRGSALAPPAAVFRAVGARTGLPPVGIGPRAWAAIAAVWVPPRTRPEKDPVEEKRHWVQGYTTDDYRWQKRKGKWYCNIPRFWSRAGSGLRAFGGPGWARGAGPAFRLVPSWTPMVRFRWGAWPLLPQQHINNFLTGKRIYFIIQK